MSSSATSAPSTASARRCANISQAPERKVVEASRSGGVYRRRLGMFLDLGGRLADRLAAERDQLVGAMKLEHADLADLELHQGVRRIAGQPRAHDAVLEDIESVDHRGQEARRRSIGVRAGFGWSVAAPPPPRD